MVMMQSQDPSVLWHLVDRVAQTTVSRTLVLNGLNKLRDAWMLSQRMGRNGLVKARSESLLVRHPTNVANIEDMCGELRLFKPDDIQHIAPSLRYEILEFRHGDWEGDCASVLVEKIPTEYLAARAKYWR